MNIALVQIQSAAGRISENVERHLELSAAAEAEGANAIVFPELSITGYEPGLAQELAMESLDLRLAPLKAAAETLAIAISVGMPLQTNGLPLISMFTFFPNGDDQIYSKLKLFVELYKRAKALGASCVIASAAKSQKDIVDAHAHYSKASKKFSIVTAFANAVGPADNFISGGRSAAWNENGGLMGSMNNKEQGLLVVDTTSRTAQKVVR